MGFGRKGGFFHFATGIGTIIIISLFWIFLMHAVELSRTTFTTVTPSSFAGYTVDTTDITTQYDLAYNSYYFSLLFISIIIFIWIVRSSISEQAVIGGAD